MVKIYNVGEVEIKALDEISFSIDKGEFVIVVGPSGAVIKKELSQNDS